MANSSFQVEGEPENSDWLAWTKTPGRIQDGTNADHATGFFRKYEEDFRLASELGSTGFRISIAWERIEPRPGVWNEEALLNYERMLVKMREFGLEPVVTLHHFVLPQWLAERGGVLTPSFSDEFADYAEEVIARLSRAPASVRWWMTFNEPMVLVKEGFRDGTWPPGIKDENQAIQAACALARAHIEAVRKIRALPNAHEINISIAHHWRVFEPIGLNPLNYFAAKLIDWIFNRQFLRAVMTGKLLFWAPGTPLIRERMTLPQNRPTLDYLGINYYGRILCGVEKKPPFIHFEEGPGARNDLGWEYYPEGFYRCLQDAAGYGLPILVSENGLADASDSKRPTFLEDHLRELHRAREAGYNIFGYLHWSLTDNFEWAFGLRPRFGLVEVDYKTLERRPRASFYRYRELIRKYSHRS